MKRSLAIGLLWTAVAFADAPRPLPAYTARTGNKVLFHFASEHIDVHVQSVKVCTDVSPLKGLTLWSSDLSRQIPAKIGKYVSPCTEVTDLHFVAAGDWTLIAKLENGDQAWLSILVRDEHGL